MENKIELKFYSKSENEKLARSCISTMLLPINPSVSELSDVKTAVSEAVTNAIVHGYPDGIGVVTLKAELIDKTIHINVSDEGVGIENTSVALEPFYSTRKDKEHSGMGFTIIKSFTDEMRVNSEINKGTSVYMVKNFK